jgi:hypothetical protein
MQGPYFDAQPRSHPAIRVARGAVPRLDVMARHGRPTASSCLSTLPPPTKRLTAPHAPLQPPGVAGCTTGAAPFAKAKLQRSAPAVAARIARRSRPVPNSDHKPTAGEPLVLPRLFPGQGRRRSRPILASRAALHAQGLHCVPFLLSRVLFVKQGPIYNRNKSSRDLPVKPNLK